MVFQKLCGFTCDYVNKSKKTPKENNKDIPT